MQTVLGRGLRQAIVLPAQPVNPEHQPSFILLTFVLSTIIVLLGASIVGELLKHVHTAVEGQNKKATIVPVNVNGKEQWSDDDDDTKSTEPETSSPDILAAKMFARPPPGWRAPRSCLINSY